jgi:hypothetical protein
MEHLQAAYEQFYGDCQRTLTEISYDDANEHILCVGEDKFIDFDRVAQKLWKKPTCHGRYVSFWP